MSQSARIHVVAAALMAWDGRILVARRPDGKHLAGGWEFPGGKVEPGEHPLLGLARELREELGVELGDGPHRPLGRVQHEYADRRILVEAWQCQDYTGEPRGLESQELRWCQISELKNLPLLPADAPLLDALSLPFYLDQLESTCYAVGSNVAGKAFGMFCKSPSQALAAAACGANFVVMTTLLQDTELTDLCASSVVPVFASDLSLKEAWSLGAAGVSRLPPES